MRDTFRGYYSLTEPERKAALETCVFVLDANILLNVYRVKPETADKLLRAIEELAKLQRVWIPHQVGLEFLRRRLKVIEDQRRVYDSVRKALDNQANKLQGELSQFAKHRSLDMNELLKDYRKALEKAKTQIAEHEEGHPDLSEADPFLERITEALAGKVGKGFDQEGLEKLKAEGKKRYEKQVPPGFMDQKDKDDPYGDFVVWKEVLRFAKERKEPIAFVTDDKKRDWWRIWNGKRLGPLPELVDELWKEANVNFLMQSHERFLNTLQEDLGIELGVKPERVRQEIQEALEAEVEKELQALMTSTTGLDRAAAEVLLEKAHEVQEAVVEISEDEVPRYRVASLTSGETALQADVVLIEEDMPAESIRTEVLRTLSRARRGRAAAGDAEVPYTALLIARTVPAAGLAMGVLFSRRKRFLRANESIEIYSSGPRFRPLSLVAALDASQD